MNVGNILKVAARLRRRSAETADGCIEWTGRRDDCGYGQMKVAGKTERTHRVAFVVASGDIPEGMKVCHRCDNPACIKPEHLFLGTHGDNMRDMAAKGRRGGGRLRIITPAKAIEVSRLQRAGLSPRLIGSAIGVSRATVSRFINETAGASA